MHVAPLLAIVAPVLALGAKLVCVLQSDTRTSIALLWCTFKAASNAALLQFEPKGTRLGHLRAATCATVLAYKLGEIASE